MFWTFRNLFVGVRRLPGRPDGYGLADNALYTMIQKMYEARLGKAKTVDTQPVDTQSVQPCSVTNIHLHGAAQVGNLVTGGLVHGGVQSTQNTFDDADAWEGLVDIGKQEFKRCRKIAEQEQEQLQTLTSAQTSAKDPGAIYSSRVKCWRYRCIEFDVAKFAAEGQPYLDSMEQQAYDLAAMFANEENLIGAKTGAGSITMKGTFANQTEEMDAALCVDGHLDAPHRNNRPLKMIQKRCVLCKIPR
jgi:hypothetical protein